jgi:DNA-binding MarR family transcriptional regulator
MPKSRSSIALSDVLHVENNCACLNIRKAARVVTQIYDAALAPAGIRITQFSLLIAVAGLEPVSMGGLAQRLVMDRTTLTRNLERLLEAGLISSVPSKEDRRRREVELTEEGRTTLVHALRLWKRAHAKTSAVLGEGQLDTLVATMSDTVDRLSGSPQP